MCRSVRSSCEAPREARQGPDALGLATGAAGVPGDARAVLDEVVVREDDGDCGGTERGHGGSLLSAAAVAGQTAAPGAGGAPGAFGGDAARERRDDPAIDRDAVTGGGSLDLSLQALGQAERDPGARVLAWLGG